MTKTLLRCLIYLAIISAPQSTWAESNELPQQVTLEQSISEHLYSRLDGLVPKERYKVIVHVRANEERIKVLLEGETQSQSDGKEEKPVETALPGFQLLEKNQETQKVQKAERAKFTFKTKTALKEVSVKLILDQSLDQQRKALLTEIVQSSVSSSFGTIGKVESVELDLTNIGVPVHERIANWFSTYLGARGGSAIDLAYLLALVLIFLVAALTLGRRILKVRRAMANKNAITPESASAARDGKSADPLINQIIDAYVQAPLEVRRFLCLLPERDRKIFLASIRAPALRSYFETILGTSAGSESEMGKVGIEKFESLVSELERYLKIQKEQVKHPFGFLETIDIDALRQFIQSETDPTMTLALLSNYLRKDQYGAITENWPVQEKAQLFKLIHQGTNDQQALAALELRLRERYQTLRERGIVQVKNHIQVERDILENDADINEILSLLAKEHFALSPEYQKYRVSFMDLMSMDHNLLKSVLRTVPNETLAKALVRQQKGLDLWSKLIGDVRFKLIDSIRSRHNSLEQQEVMQAQLEILRAYRAMI